LKLRAGYFVGTFRQEVFGAAENGTDVE
jgi:hypothetical protein